MKVLLLSGLTLFSALLASCGTQSSRSETTSFGGWYMYCLGELTNLSNGKSAKFDNRSLKTYEASTDIVKDQETVDKVVARFLNNCENDGKRKGINTNLCTKIDEYVPFYRQIFEEDQTRLNYRCEPRN